MIKVLVVTSLSVAFGFEREAQKKDNVHILMMFIEKRNLIFPFWHVFIFHHHHQNITPPNDDIYLRTKGIAKLKNSFCAYLTPTAITRAISSWTFSTTRLLLSSSNVSQRYDERWKLEWESVESRKLISQASNVS